jgi:undecaprenyl diphosphate synthase
MLKEADSILPAHIGIIMDGNGRWAKQHGQPRINGHREGAARVRDVVEWARDAGIRQLSLYAFSTENWNRPKLEVRALMSLLAFVLPQNVPGMQEEGVRFRVLGDISALPGSARRAVEQACEETVDNDAIDLIMCLNYGGQQEILAGVQRALGWIQAQKNQQKALAELTPEMFRSMLWRRDIAPLDLLIRTGGERRISNFHLWDAAYAELYFTDVYWPDYSRREFQAALNDYAARERRYGKTSDQVAA